MKLKPATQKQVIDVELALHYLKLAKACLIDADCPRTLERTRLAISSAKGAVRHVERRYSNTLKGKP